MGVVEFGIFINLALNFIMAVPVNFMAYIIISSVQMGATVDYAILLATKFKRNMATMPVKQACYKAAKDSTLSILTSATILGALCLAVCAITTNAIISQVTLLIGRGAIISAILILFVLPSLLIAITRKPPTNNDIFTKIRAKIATKKGKNDKQCAVVAQETVGETIDISDSQVNENNDKINITGGEPTLNPYFADILEIMLQESAFKTISTNLYDCGAQHIEQMLKIHQFAIMCAPTTSQYAAVDALRNGDEDVKMMKEAYNQRRRYLMHMFQKMKLPCFEPYGAFYAFPCIQQFGMTSDEFATRLLREEKVAVVPGNAFGESGEGFIRISYAYSIDELKEALMRIERYLQKKREAGK